MNLKKVQKNNSLFKNPAALVAAAAVLTVGAFLLDAQVRDEGQTAGVWSAVTSLVTSGSVTE